MEASTLNLDAKDRDHPVRDTPCQRHLQRHLLTLVCRARRGPLHPLLALVLRHPLLLRPTSPILPCRSRRFSRHLGLTCSVSVVPTLPTRSVSVAPTSPSRLGSTVPTRTLMPGISSSSYRSACTRRVSFQLSRAAFSNFRPILMAVAFSKDVSNT